MTSATTPPDWISAVAACPDVGDVAVLPPGSLERTTVLMVPHGMQTGAALRQLVLDAAPSREGLQVALVLEIPRRDGELDAAAAIRAVRDCLYLLPYEPPETAAEKALVAELLELVQPVDISVTDDLVGLGGDSLTAILLAERLADRHGVTVEPLDLFAAPSVRELSRTLFGDRSGGTRS